MILHTRFSIFFNSKKLNDIKFKLKGKTQVFFAYRRELKYHGKNIKSVNEKNLPTRIFARH